MAFSRFRHVQPVPAHQDKQFLNMNPTGALWDCSNLMACNDRFIAIPWSQLGTTAVFRHSDYGKISSTPPVLLGQEGHVIDVAFNPFDSSKLFTASEDGTIMGWDIPEEGLKENCSDNIVHLQGHSKKVGIMNFHPSAENVLASAGADMVVNIWDVNTAKAGYTLKCHTEQIMSIDWNLNGSLLCSTSRDRKLNVVDPRKGSIVNSANAHQSTKTQRAVWARRSDMILTVGFNKIQARQVMLWDTRSLEMPVQTEDVDQTCAVMLPFFDDDTNLLYIGSRGDGGIRSFELMEGRLVNCTSYASTEAHKGLCMVPKWMLDTRQCEIARFYALTQKSLYTIQMLLPRKQADVKLQEDVYPPTFSDKPALSTSEYFAGENRKPLVMSMQPVFERTTPVASRGMESDAKSGHTLSRHTDPALIGKNRPLHNDGEDESHSLRQQLQPLLLELKRRQEEVKKCREELRRQESLMNEVIAKIHTIASGNS
ncbi:protein of unknown function (DUF1899) WD domain [Trypanosoma vivax]|uniref:Coronin n=1 Tax=Trypanosoma vivax (strain Y486) TaxID=1055687 RepID=G0U0P6_TRYVY|nr:putative coronin [Trypanosoma vivax]KAH8609135.1 protein of unknown function (DUF1899) WD domain [Trypanosoma vivax]CCC49645.1 putative coronin [Trypanosoma vivax Y486]